VFQAAQHALAVALVDAGRAKEAIPYFEREQGQSPKDPEVWANLVQAKFAAGDRQAAFKSADEATATIPDNAHLAVLLAQICLNYQQPQKARHLLENASELAPQDKGVSLLLAKASLAAGEPVEALAVLKRLPADAGKKGEMAFLEGVALGRAGKFEEATKELSAAIAADSQNVDYLVTYAWLQQLGGYYQEALTTIDKARRLQSSSAAIPFTSAVSYFFLHQYSRAAEFGEEAIHLAPRSAPSYLLLGMAKLRQGDSRAAEAALRQGLALQPQKGFFHRELGVALFEAGESNEGKKELDQALALDPKDAPAYFWRARIFATQGQKERAITDLETAVEIQPSYPGAYRELARLYRESGEAQKAAQAMTKQGKLPDTEAEQDRALLLQQFYSALP